MPTPAINVCSDPCTVPERCAALIAKCSRSEARNCFDRSSREGDRNDQPTTWSRAARQWPHSVTRRSATQQAERPRDAAQSAAAAGLNAYSLRTAER